MRRPYLSILIACQSICLMQDFRLLKVKAAWSCRTLVSYHTATWHYNQEYYNLNLSVYER